MNPDMLPLFTEGANTNEGQAEQAVDKKTLLAKESAATKAASKRVIAVHSHPLNGWVAEKQYYTIGEVAGLFQINTSHIRFWTKEFGLKVRTTKKGDRLYTPAQVTELGGIYHLVKEKGFTLTGAKAKLKEEKKGVGESVNLKESLLKLKEQLSSIRNRLD